MDIDYKELGRKACKKYYPDGNIFDVFAKVTAVFDNPPPGFPSKEFNAFLGGWQEHVKNEEERRRKESGVDEFLQDLKLLCLAYGVQLCSGTDENGGYGIIKGYQFPFDINPSNL